MLENGESSSLTEADIPGAKIKPKQWTREQRELLPTNNR